MAEAFPTDLEHLDPMPLGALLRLLLFAVPQFTQYEVLTEVNRRGIRVQTPQAKEVQLGVGTSVVMSGKVTVLHALKRGILAQAPPHTRGSTLAASVAFESPCGSPAHAGIDPLPPTR